MTWDDVVAESVANGWHGAENLSLIPGEVGASAVQNIGAYGAEAKDLIFDVEAVEIATGNVVRLFNADCEYAYRQSRFKHEWKTSSSLRMSPTASRAPSPPTSTTATYAIRSRARA